MEVRAAGAHGYIVKSQAARGLIVAIDRILAKARSFGPEPGATAASN